MFIYLYRHERAHYHCRPTVTQWRKGPEPLGNDGLVNLLKLFDKQLGSCIDCITDATEVIERQQRSSSTVHIDEIY